jgi:lipopolysaccharide export system protein LptA
MIFSIYSCKTFAVASCSDDMLSVKADNLEAWDEGKKIRFYGNVLISFRDYVITTSEAIVSFIRVGNQKRINTALIPKPLKVINKSNIDEIILGDKAEYNLDSKTLIITDNVKVQKNNSLVVVNKLILKFKNK